MMRFGLFFFGVSGQATDNHLQATLSAARFADNAAFEFVSTPERHFHAFGGAFPNPAVTSAAIAAITERIQIRAGSLVSPLHDPVRVVEDWSIVDNISGGRVGISFGSGWNPNDFLLAPDAFASRRELMYEQIDTIRTVWRTGRIERRNGLGVVVELPVVPRPLQHELPFWLTSSGSEETMRRAGAMGANLLTHLENQDLASLKAKIDVYRAARTQAGLDAAAGKVTVMQHTFVSASRSACDRARGDLLDYLLAALDLEGTAVAAGAEMSGRKTLDPAQMRASSTRQELAKVAANRYVTEAALIGDLGSCIRCVRRLRDCGIDEVACLIDFVHSPRIWLEALPALSELRRRSQPNERLVDQRSAVTSFMRSAPIQRDGDTARSASEGSEPGTGRC